MQKINPFLWFDDQAEEAMNFYVSIFKNSRELRASPAMETQARDRKERSWWRRSSWRGKSSWRSMAARDFRFSEAISFLVNCETQQEVDYLWEKLCEGGAPSRCGWLKDKFGVSWQIVPTILLELLGDKDPEISKRVMQAMMQMDKLDIDGLRRAAEK